MTVQSIPGKPPALLSLQHFANKERMQRAKGKRDKEKNQPLWEISLGRLREILTETSPSPGSWEATNGITENIR